MRRFMLSPSGSTVMETHSRQPHHLWSLWGRSSKGNNEEYKVISGYVPSCRHVRKTSAADLRWKRVSTVLSFS